MADRADISALIEGRIGRDRQGLDPDLYVERGLRYYERFRPREVVVAGTGNGTEQVAISAISDLASRWVPGFSRILWLEYPVGDVPPSIYDQAEDFGIHDLANTGTNLETRVQAVLFHTVIPSSAAAFRLKVTLRHTATSTYCTVPAEDMEPLADFCAAEFFEDLAGIYAGLASQEAGGADLAFNYTEKATEARAQARAKRRRGRVILGLSADERDDEALSNPSIVSADYDMAPRLHGGLGGLTHNRRRF